MNEIKTNISPLYDYDNTYMNSPEKFLLGVGIENSDNRTFILNINIARFVWVAKHDGRSLTLTNFKNFFNFFVRIQKTAGVLRQVRDLDPNALWI